MDLSTCLPCPGKEADGEAEDSNPVRLATFCSACARRVSRASRGRLAGVSLASALSAAGGACDVDARAGGGGREPRPADGRCLAAAPRGRHANAARRGENPTPPCAVAVLRSSLCSGVPVCTTPQSAEAAVARLQAEAARADSAMRVQRGVPIPGGGLCSAELPFTGKDR